MVKNNGQVQSRRARRVVPHELNEADRRILEALADGRANPSYLADELDYTRQYVHQRLQLLVAAEYVENIGHGLYQRVDDPHD